MGKITDLIQAYRDGTTTLEDLASTLAVYPFATPERYQDRPTDPAAYYSFITDASFDDPDTWDEVEDALWSGLLTSDEYYTISEARDAAQTPEGGDLTPVRAFNPDEARDDRGRWTGDGSSDESLGAATDRVMKSASAAVKQTQADVTALVEAGGGIMHRPEMALKGHDRLQEKIAADMKDKGLGTTAAANGIFDAMRFGMIIPADRYTATVKSTFSALEAKGYTIQRIKNSWLPGHPYRGLNAVLRTPSGVPFELQAQTPESRDMKRDLSPGGNRTAYELVRNPDTPAAERRRLSARMVANAAKLTMPPGVLTIGTPIPPPILP